MRALGGWMDDGDRRGEALMNCAVLCCAMLGTSTYTIILRWTACRRRLSSWGWGMG